MEPIGDLIGALRHAGDGPAGAGLFAEVVRRFQDMALGCAHSITGDYHLAEDAAQEAFVVAWRQLPALRDPAAFPGWFRRIVVSTAHRALRGRVAEAPLEEAGAVSAEGVAALAERRDLRVRVGRAVAHLPEAERAAVALYYLGEASVGDVAAFLAVPPSTIKSRLHAARRRLRQGALAMEAEQWAQHRPSRDRGFAERVAARLRPFRTDLPYFEERAAGLLAVVGDGLGAALAVVREAHPGAAGRTDAEIRAAFGPDDARLVVARQHGFESWTAFAAHIASLSAGSAPGPFAEAFAALQAGATDGLASLLDAHPDLLAARGTNGNTLLHLAVGLRARAAVRLLLERGAAANAPNDRNWTALHQAAYANEPELARALLGAGAGIGVEARGSGGTPLAVSLFWGHRETAEVLARAGVLPANLRLAAGLGRLDLLEALVDPDGRPLPQAGLGRGFYRPHSGFPAWTARDDPQEILDEALTWAARSGRIEALAWLAEHGADLDADPYGGTALAWAANKGRAEAVDWLLDHGADVNRRGTFGGDGQGVTALHIAAGGRSLAIVRRLVERGADLRIRDERHGGDPLGWAHHGGASAIVAYLEKAGRAAGGR